MKKHLFSLAALFLWAMTSMAQVSTYNFASSPGTYTPLATETILWSGYFDDDLSGSITIPGFTMSGVTYTNMYVSANGFITLGTTATYSWIYPISEPTAYDRALAPFGADLVNAASGTPKISYNTNVSGEIVVQWQDVGLYGYGGRLSFQLRLNPCTGTIRFVYGGTITGGTVAINVQVGLRGATNADFNNRVTATDWSATTPGAINNATCTFSSTVLPAAGLTYTYSVCSPITTFPFTESFDGTTFPPTCWSNQNTVNTDPTKGPGIWDRQTSGSAPSCTPHSGAGMARFDSWEYWPGTTGILVTPQLALPSDQYEVRFWMYRDDWWYGGEDHVNVYYNTCLNTTGAILLGTIYRHYGHPPAESTGNQWYEYTFTMPSGSSGNAYIIFEGVSEKWANIFIDDVIVKAIFNCPPGSTAEQEPCGQDLNGGCNMGTPAFEPIAIGETKCGTAWCDGLTRDTDWYIFTLTETTDVTFTASAEFPVLIGFVASPCPAIDFINDDYGAAGSPVSITSTLPAGTYYAFVAPMNFSTIIQCGGADTYWAKLTCPACFVEHFPFTESFNETTFPPLCWINQNWQRVTSGTDPACAPHSGAAMTCFFYWEYGTPNILATPTLDLPSDQYEVRFWMYRDDGYPGNADRVNVYYNTSPSTTGATLLGTINRYYRNSPLEDSPNQWYEYAFNMPGGSSGNAFIIFEGIAEYGNDIFLDDIEVKPVCLVETFPHNESFEGTAFPPTCWANVKTSGLGVPGIWDRQTTGIHPTCAPHSGAAMTRFDSYDYTNGTKGILVTSQLALPSDQYMVDFWMYRDNGYSGEADLVSVYYNTSANTTGATLLGTIYRYYGYNPVVGTPNQWYEYAFTMPAGSSGNAYIVFEGVSLFGNSMFIDDIKIKPSCLVQALPFNESFDGTTFAPTCWTNQNTVNTDPSKGPGTWDRQTSGIYPTCTPHSGAGMARYDSWDYWPGTTGILVTPQLDLPSPTDQYLVDFWMFRDSWYTGNDRVNIYYNTLPNTTGATLLGTIYRLYNYSPVVATPNQWYEYVYPLPAGYYGNTYIVFEGVSDYEGRIYLDDVKMEQLVATTTTVPSTVVPDGQSFCCDATQTITVGGNPPIFVVSSEGSATMIAGMNILYKPGTVVHLGGYMHGYIAPGGPFCMNNPLVKSIPVEDTVGPPVTATSSFKIYPNPTPGKFTLELTGDEVNPQAIVRIYSMMGTEVISQQLTGSKTDFSLESQPVGIYIVSVLQNGKMETAKIIRQ